MALTGRVTVEMGRQHFQVLTQHIHVVFPHKPSIASITQSAQPGGHKSSLTSTSVWNDFIFFIALTI